MFHVNDKFLLNGHYFNVNENTKDFFIVLRLIDLKKNNLGQDFLVWPSFATDLAWNDSGHFLLFVHKFLQPVRIFFDNFLAN